MIRQLTLAALLISAAIPAHAADGARNAPPLRKAVQVDVFGDDPCPKGVGDEIVVCARLPESERFRIPAPLRRSKYERREQSWVTRTRDIEETGRAQRPNSCSPVGSGGQTGCFEQFMRDAAAQRKADAAANAVP
jgi:hypothetical protein